MSQQALDGLRELSGKLQELHRVEHVQATSETLAQLMDIKNQAYDHYKDLAPGEFGYVEGLVPLQRLAELQQHYERKQEQE